MTVVGGMTLSQGILTSADATAINVDKISVREGEITRTDLDIVRVTPLSWADYLRVTVKNGGQTKLASFDKWDIIVSYTDNSGTLRATWLPYSDALPGDNEWQNARIGLNGPIEFFEPGIINPLEEMVALIHLDPLAGNGTDGDISVATPNGVCSLASFTDPGYLRLTAQSENITIANTKYYELVEAAPADGAVINVRADYANKETGRKLLYNSSQPTRPAKFIYPLIGIEEIPAETWTVYYRCYVDGTGSFPREDNDVSFNIDILIRQADGSVRATIATAVATVWFEEAAQGSWITLSATYNFPGYTVQDENDYLEIDYYGDTINGPNGGGGYLQLSIDDNTLPVADQTRIEV